MADNMIRIGVDASGVEAGVEKAKKSIKSLGQAAGEISNHLTVYAVDLDSGRLTASQRCATGERPICVEIAEV